MDMKVCATLDRGLAYGEACFETFRVVGGAVFCWDRHIARLRTGLAGFGLDLSDASVESILQRCQSEAMALGQDVLIRVTVTGGEAPWGLVSRQNSPGVYIQIMPAMQRSGELALHRVAWPFPLRSKPAKFTSDYAETLRALSKTPHRDAVFVYDHRVVAAATANVALFRDGIWWTPVAGDGIVPGVVRQALLDRGIIIEKECPSMWLDDCEAAVLLNSGIFVREAASVDGRRLGTASNAVGALKEALRGQPGVPDVL